MPGDQVWQFCNASQELEGARQCLAPPSDSGPSSQLSAQPEREDHEHEIVASSNVDQAPPETNEEAGLKRQDGIEAPQEDDQVGSPSLGEVEEGGCTLHLEALRVELEPETEPPPLEELTETATVEFRPLDPSGPLGTERPGGLEEPALSSFDSVETPALVAEEEPIVEKLASEPPRNPLISEEAPNTFKAALTAETVPLPAFPESESLLKAMRRQDKEQAEALVLEGRVQMVVIQGEGRAFRCPHCPFITRREKALTLHSKSGCQGRREPLLCPECGASFKQQRGLSTHMMKKCPVLLRKNKALPKPVSPTLHLQLPGSQASQDAESRKPPPLPSKVELLLPKDAPSQLPGEPGVEEPLPTPSSPPENS